MTLRQLGSLHAFALLNEVMAFHDRQFMPAIPFDIAILPKNGIKAGFIERDVLPCMPEQLRKLISLKCQHVLRRPILAFHQHVENPLMNIVHGGNSQT